MAQKRYKNIIFQEDSRNFNTGSFHYYQLLGKKFIEISFPFEEEASLTKKINKFKFGLNLKSISLFSF